MWQPVCHRNVVSVCPSRLLFWGFSPKASVSRRYLYTHILAFIWSVISLLFVWNCDSVTRRQYVFQCFNYILALFRFHMILKLVLNVNILHWFSYTQACTPAVYCCHMNCVSVSFVLFTYTCWQYTKLYFGQLIQVRKMFSHNVIDDNFEFNAGGVKNYGYHGHELHLVLKFSWRKSLSFHLKGR